VFIDCNRGSPLASDDSCSGGTKLNIGANLARLCCDTEAVSCTCGPWLVTAAFHQAVMYRFRIHDCTVCIIQLQQGVAKRFQSWKDATIACCGSLTCIDQANCMSSYARWKLLLGAAVHQTSWSIPWKGRLAEKASAVRALSLPLSFHCKQTRDTVENLQQFVSFTSKRQELPTGRLSFRTYHEAHGHPLLLK
jgi:hypothetical protein